MIKQLCALALCLVLIACAQNTGSPQLPEGHEPQPVACTMDAKICPGGETVGRTEPNCEFEACPEVQSCTGPADEPVPCAPGYTCYSSFGRGGNCFASQEGACLYYCNTPACDISADGNEVMCEDPD